MIRNINFNNKPKQKLYLKTNLRYLITISCEARAAPRNNKWRDA